MSASFRRKAAAVSTALVLGAVLTGSSAQARDFFTSFLGGLLNHPAPSSSSNEQSGRALPFAAEFGDATAPPQPRASQSASAYCVRSCDGRYFPITGAGGQSRAQTCKSFCPASETKVVYGAGIDNAYTDNGKRYSELPNAFRYRNELVSGCTCNGKDVGGLARVDIKDDPTVRRGDLVADADGKLTGAPKTTASAANYSPRPRVARNSFPFPIFAAQ